MDEAWTVIAPPDDDKASREFKKKLMPEDIFIYPDPYSEEMDKHVPPSVIPYLRQMRQQRAFTEAAEKLTQAMQLLNAQNAFTDDQKRANLIKKRLHSKLKT